MGIFDNFTNASSWFSGNRVGDDVTSNSTVINNSDDDVYNTQNFYGSNNSAGGITTLQRKTTDITSEPVASVEKPFSFAPALFGGGTTTATGEGEAGISLTPIIAVLGGVVLVGGLGYVFISTKKGKRK